MKSCAMSYYRTNCSTDRRGKSNRRRGLLSKRLRQWFTQLKYYRIVIEISEKWCVCLTLFICAYRNRNEKNCSLRSTPQTGPQCNNISLLYVKCDSYKHISFYNTSIYFPLCPSATGTSGTITAIPRNRIEILPWHLTTLLGVSKKVEERERESKSYW